MKIAILGATGQLGQDLVRVLHQSKVYPLSHEQADITKPSALKKTLNDIAPDIVINCAAWTDVPGCEKDPKKAFELNAVAAHHVALACHSFQAKLVHISTDYVFDGRNREPYTELALPAPVNVYGLSKLTGEHYVRMVHDRVFIVRTSGLYGIHPCRGKKANFVETMLGLAKTQDVIKVVDDEVLTPTFTVHLAHQVRILMQTEYYGLYHATAQGACSWFDLTRKLFELAKINTRLEKISSKEFKSPVRRPAYSVLKNLNLQNHGIDFMKFWDEGLQDYFLDKENKLAI
jgi:dTDP-4-dehydrorhamnose reductase